MKENIIDRASNGEKLKSQQNPNKPRFTDDQVQLKEAPKQDLKSADEKVAVQPSKPYPVPTSDQPPKVDAHEKVAREETAQETVHEVMTKKEASKLVSKETPEKR